MLLASASLTKSAQFPFSPWLPAAISAPTPVSSLVHSSTLVTAGLFLLLLIPSSFLSPVLFKACGLFWVTHFLASFLGLVSQDLKAVVAFSTLSQLSFVFLLFCGGCASLGCLHIRLHAFLKRALFIACGFILHSSRGAQDPRLTSSQPPSSLALVVSSVCSAGLAGLPWFTAFYRKELALRSSEWGPYSAPVPLLFSLRAFVTLAYIFRFQASVHRGYLGSVHTGGVSSLGPSVSGALLVTFSRAFLVDLCPLGL